MPTWDSNPSDLMTLVDMMARDLDTSDTTEALPAKPPPAWLRSFIQRVQAIRVERDCVIFGYEYATRIMRSAITELGARLATRSELGDRTDIFHCRLCELESLVRYGTPLPLAQIEHRKAAYTEDDERRDTEAAASEIHGLRASPGAYTGLARVVLTPADFASVRRGDILVCAVTSPSWLPLLELAGAVVTDLGGMLSHAAIVAREFKIPAVTGTSVATRKMISGARYQVDGSRGVVRAVME
jgi:pyruvate,water dikinase